METVDADSEDELNISHLVGYESSNMIMIMYNRRRVFESDGGETHWSFTSLKSAIKNSIASSSGCDSFLETSRSVLVSFTFTDCLKRGRASVEEEINLQNMLCGILTKEKLIPSRFPCDV